MNALSATTFFHCPSTPHKAFPPTYEQPYNKFNSFSSILSHTKRNSNSISAQLSVNSGVSTCDQTLLFNDWPQLLQISIGSADLLLGQAIHGFLHKMGLQNELFGGNNLINMYAKFNRMDCAQRLFDEMLDRNTITWTTIINGYSQIQDINSVFRIARDMHRLQEEFNEHTCSVILRACELPEDRIQGEQIHDFVIKSGFLENIVVVSSLISMYSRSGYVVGGEELFNDLNSKDVQCFNLMILEYGKVGYGDKAIQVFCDLLYSGLDPNIYTFTNILGACKENIGVEEGRQLNGLAVKHGLVRETSVANATITMYGKYGMVKEAEKTFLGMDERNMVSWTALISAYIRNDHCERALNLFIEMVDLGVSLDSNCLATVLDGCSECKNTMFGVQIHGFMIKLGFLSDNCGTALIDLYAKCGNLSSARLLFNGISIKSIIPFNALLAGFMEIDGDNKEEAMVLFNQLRIADIAPDSVTFTRLLSLSADQACLVKGKSLHSYAIKTGFEADLTVCNAIITMYAKCGSIKGAYKMFTAMDGPDLVSWNAMVSAFARHGQGKEAVLLFEEMIREGLHPDKITILSVLQACSLSGLLDYGFCLFNEMEVEYGIKPVLEHCACMVDLLGRAGRFEEAMDFIKNSPFLDSPLLWRTLVNACKLSGDLEFGKLASKHLLDLVPKEAGSYTLVSNMYSEGGMLDEAAKVRTVMNDLRISKEAGCSWIEIDNKTHRFVASGRDHSQSVHIYAKLDLLKYEMTQNYDTGTNLELIWDPF